MSNTRNSRPVFVQGGKIFIFDPVNEEYDEIDSQVLVNIVKTYDPNEEVQNNRQAIIEAKLDYLINKLAEMDSSSSRAL